MALDRTPLEAPTTASICVPAVVPSVSHNWWRLNWSKPLKKAFAVENRQVGRAQSMRIFGGRRSRGLREQLVSTIGRPIGHPEVP